MTTIYVRLETQLNREEVQAINIEKKIKPLLEKLENQGWTVKTTKKGWIVYPPDKTKNPVVVHKTPSDKNWQKVFLRYLKRSGF